MLACYAAGMRLALVSLLFASTASAQSPLQEEIRSLASEARGKVSVACRLPDSPTGAHRMKSGRTVLVHKAGTSGVRNGMAGATNDIGLVASRTDGGWRWPFS